MSGFGRISAVAFDFGGTLDGEGSHWLDRFHAIYASCQGLSIEPGRIREAFYEADRRLEADPTIGSCGFEEMMRRHVAWQFRHLGIDDAALAGRLAISFTAPAREALARNRLVLERMRAEGYRLGVVSNFYGNVATLCAEAGLAPFLDVVLDSAVVGLRKPDPALFAMAVERLGAGAGETAMVGDSFERDVRPARALGMRTFWLAAGRPCPDAVQVDAILDRLADLPGLLAGTSA